MEVEDENSDQMLWPSTANPCDNVPADSERLMAGGTSFQSGDQTSDNAQPCPTFVSPCPDAPRELSGIVGPADFKRLSRAENVQSCSTFLSPQSPLSPGLSVALEVPSPGASTATSPLLRTRVSSGARYNSGHRSTSPNVADPSTFSGRNTAIEEIFPTPSGKSGAVEMADKHSEEGVPQHPISSKAVPRSTNKHESQVVPDEHTIVDDALLKCTPYIVNIKYMVLICTDCRYCIIPGRALDHLRKEHRHCKVDTTFSEQLDQRFPRLVTESIHPPETIEAVFGLAIPDEKYTVCSRCCRGYVDVASWKHHLCRNADADLAGRHAHFQSHVQTFFRGPRICYFPVELPVSVSDGTNGDDFSLFKTDFQELAVSDSELHESEDYRELTQFLLKEGWINHVVGCSPSELLLLTCLPKEGEVLKSAGSEVAALMSSIQAGIGTAGYHVRRLLGRRPAYVFHIID